MPQASFFALANHCGSDPDDDLLRYSDSAAERQPDAAPIIAIDAIERRIDGVDGGVSRGHEITRTPTRRRVVSGSTDLPRWISRRRQNDG